MKQRFVVAILLFITTTSTAQIITWQRSYRGLGPVGFESLTSIVQTPDSGFIAVGNTRPGGGAGTYMMAMRLNKFGDSIWFRKFDLATAVRVIRAFDGNYVIASLNGDLVKLDLSGDTLWTRRIGNSSIKVNSLRESASHDLITVGAMGTSFIPVLRKSDIYGNLTFERIFSDLSYTQLTDIAFDKNICFLSGYKLLGSYLQIIKCDSGARVISKGSIESPWFRPSSLVISTDKYLVLGGDSKPQNGEGISASLIKLDTALNVVWHRSYDNGEPQFGYCNEMVKTSDGGFAIAGSVSRDSVYVLAPMARLIKTDTNGNQLIYRKYGFDSISAGNLDGAFITQTYDGGFAIGGSRDIGDYSYHIVKTDSVGSSEPVGINDVETLIEAGLILFQNYPNPFNANTKIKFRTNKTLFITIVIYDQLGRQLRTIANGSYIEGLHEVSFSAEDLPSGVYYCAVRNQDLRIVKKFIIAK